MTAIQENKHSTPVADKNKSEVNLINPEDVAATYRRYAPIYDRLFGAVLEPMWLPRSRQSPC
jgi:hypothetical protein